MGTVDLVSGFFPHDSPMTRMVSWFLMRSFPEAASLVKTSTTTAMFRPLSATSVMTRFEVRRTWPEVGSGERISVYCSPCKTYNNK